MGGNALKKHTVRIPASEYSDLVKHCTGKIKELYPNARVLAIPAYSQKQDFGDLDLLVCDSDFNPLDAAVVLDAVELVRNGSVTSIGVMVGADSLFQVDLIKMPAEHFDYALNYFSFNDLGNLCGRIAHKMGLKHGHDGLTYTLRDGTHQFGEIVLTTDFDKALAFLGYSSERFHQGFDTLEDIFRFTVSTPFFNKEIFLLENRNHAARVRDRKRKTYMEFLTWVESQKDLPSFVFPHDKSEWFPRVNSFFPQFQAEYDVAWARLEKTRAVAAKFSGEWVAQLTGLEGKALGVVMRRFKESFESGDAMREFVLETSLEDLAVRVRQIQAELDS